MGIDPTQPRGQAVCLLAACCQRMSADCCQKYPVGQEWRTARDTAAMRSNTALSSAEEAEQQRARAC